MSSPSAASLSERRHETVMKHVAAENAGDVDGTIASFDRPRYNVIAMGSISEGEASVRTLLSGLLTAFPDFHFEVGRVLHADEAIVVEGVMEGTQRADWAGIPARGNRMAVPAACIFDFEGERLVNETVYFDFAMLQRQLAL